MSPRSLFLLLPLTNSRVIRSCDDIVRALHRRLQGGSPRAVMHTLVLIETVVKNGPPAVHTQVASRAFVTEVAALADGSLGVDVQHKALELIKQWADAFTGDAAYAAFQDTYRQLKIQGVVFPEAEQEVPIFTPPSSAATAGGSSRGGDTFGTSSSRSTTPRGSASPRAGATAVDGKPSASTRAQQIAKLHADLQVVMEKIDLYRDFRAQGESDNSYEDVVDFLRQCQPRMNTLIEGGIVGKIDEQTLEQCLNVRVLWISCCCW